MEMFKITVWIQFLAVVSAYEISGACKDEAGNEYENGADFPADDGCNNCFCSDGIIGCTLMACLPPQVCVHNGIEYKEGDGFLDDCNKCRCGHNGAAMCTKKACPPKVCEYSGKMYGAGEQFMDADGCNRCTCTETGLAACTLMMCV